MTHEMKAQLIEAIEIATKAECRVIALDAFTFTKEDIDAILEEMHNMGYETNLEFDSDFNMYSINF